VVPPPTTKTVFTVNEHYGSLLNLPDHFKRKTSPILPSASLFAVNMLLVFQHETPETVKFLEGLKLDNVDTSDTFRQRVHSILNESGSYFQQLCRKNFDEAYASREIEDVTFGILCLACFYQWNHALGRIKRSCTTPFTQGSFLDVFVGPNPSSKFNFNRDDSDEEKLEKIVPFMTEEQIDRCLSRAHAPTSKKVRVHRHYATMLGLREEQFDIYDRPIVIVTPNTALYLKVFQKEQPDIVDLLLQGNFHLGTEDFKSKLQTVYKKQGENCFTAMVDQEIDLLVPERVEDFTQGFLACASSLQWSRMLNIFDHYFKTKDIEALKHLVADFEKSIGPIPQSEKTSLDTTLCYVIPRICFDDFMEFTREKNNELFPDQGDY